MALVLFSETRSHETQVGLKLTVQPRMTRSFSSSCPTSLVMGLHQTGLHWGHWEWSPGQVLYQLCSALSPIAPVILYYGVHLWSVGDSVRLDLESFWDDFSSAWWLVIWLSCSSMTTLYWNHYFSKKHFFSGYIVSLDHGMGTQDVHWIRHWFYTF